MKLFLKGDGSSGMHTTHQMQLPQFQGLNLLLLRPPRFLRVVSIW